MLPTDQIENIKKQVISMIDSTNLPNKEEVKKSITQMNPEQLEQFLIKNKLIQSDGQQADASSPGRLGGNSPDQQCIFCSIVSGAIESYKIDDNKDSIAILEINPISNAHSLIIPKKHIESSDKLPKTAFTLAKKIAKKIKTRYKPKDVKIISSNFMNHEILNVLPIYENETLESPRTQAKPEELEKLKNQLEKKSKPKTIKKSKPKKIKEKLWLPRRIP